MDNCGELKERYETGSPTYSTGYGYIRSCGSGEFGFTFTSPPRDNFSILINCSAIVVIILFHSCRVAGDCDYFNFYSHLICLTCTVLFRLLLLRLNYDFSAHSLWLQCWLTGCQVLVPSFWYNSKNYYEQAPRHSLPSPYVPPAKCLIDAVSGIEGVGFVLNRVFAQIELYRNWKRFNYDTYAATMYEPPQKYYRWMKKMNLVSLSSGCCVFFSI